MDTSRRRADTSTSPAARDAQLDPGLATASQPQPQTGTILSRSLKSTTLVMYSNPRPTAPATHADSLTPVFYRSLDFESAALGARRWSVVGGIFDALLRHARPS